MKKGNNSASSVLLFSAKKMNIKIHITVISCLFLYMGVEFALSLREEHRPRVFEKRVPRKISGPNRK
jgi:hypothetical protein